jgi:GABA(A) receptor-associated protein
MSFKQTRTFTQRSHEANKMLEKYPNRIPVICEVDENNKDIKLDKLKYLVPDSLTVGQFLDVIRRRIKLGSQEALFIIINNTTLLPTSALMSYTYVQHKDKDGFLYISLTKENTFG